MNRSDPAKPSPETSVELPAEIEALLTDWGNCLFWCGEFKGDSLSGYDIEVIKADNARAALVARLIEWNKETYWRGRFEQLKESTEAP